MTVLRTNRCGREGAVGPPSRFGRAIRAGMSSLVLALPVAARAQAPADGAKPASSAQAAADSAPGVAVWRETLQLPVPGRVTDVSFLATSRNIVHPADIAWCADTDTRALVAVASRPIPGTASPGEEMGRRGAGALGHPVALHVHAAGQFVLEADGRMEILRSGWTDSVALAPFRGAGRDVVVGTSGLVYVLAGDEVRVFPDPPSPDPLWTLAVPRALGPAVAIGVTSGGRVLMAGQGPTALAVFDLDSTGGFRQVAARTARDLGVRRLAGIAVTPTMILTEETREGWVQEDRYVVLSDAELREFVALDATTLEPLGRVAAGSVTPGAVPGRIDVSNRGQIAFVDPETGRAHALPTRVLLDLLRGAAFRWRSLLPDTTAAGGGGRP